MIAPKMIRKMGKTYGDKAMTKDCQIHYQADAWSNGFIAFKEPLPKHLNLEYDDVVEHDFWSETETNMNLHENLVQVWPVEIRSIADGGMRRMVRMSDGRISACDTWLDAGYVGAVLKRQPTATFFVAKSKAIVAKNGRPFAMIMPLSWDNNEQQQCALQSSDWSIVNDDLDAAREFDTANELSALLPDRPGFKWHRICYMGTTLEVRRSGRNNKERTLHVRALGRDATASISLYDGRGMRG